MSLGIQLKGTAKDPSALSKLYFGSDHQAFAKKMHEWAEKSLDWKTTVNVFGAKAPSVVTFEWHPGIEECQLHAMPNGDMIFRGRSTPSGPGYHQTMVDLIETITQKYSLEWSNWNEADATGYLSHKNREQLEKAFINWFHGFAKFVKEYLPKAEGQCVSMDLPHGIRVAADGHIATTLGPQNEKWLDEVIATPDERCLDFFPWWDQEQNALYHQGVALTLAWNLIAWRAPETDREEDVMVAFCEACEKAVDMEADIALPRAAWRACATWLKRDIPSGAEGPDQIGDIGYRRGLIHFPLGWNWSIRLPGDFAQDSPSGPGSWVAWDQSKRVECRIMGLKQVGAVEDILPRFKEPTQGERLTAHNPEEGFYGVGDMGQTEEGQYVLQAEYLKKNSVLILQAIGESGDREWALDVWKSVAHD